MPWSPPKTMTGIDGHHVTALSHEKLREVLARYNRLAKSD